MIGYSLRTSAAASLPSLTSCSGVYLFFGSLIAVWATRTVIVRLTTAVRTAARADAPLNVIAGSLTGLGWNHSSAQNRVSSSLCVSRRSRHHVRRVAANTVVHHFRASHTLVRGLREPNPFYVPIQPYPHARDRRRAGPHARFRHPDVDRVERNRRCHVSQRRRAHRSKSDRVGAHDRS